MSDWPMRWRASTWLIVATITCGAAAALQTTAIGAAALAFAAIFNFQSARRMRRLERKAWPELPKARARSKRP